jgi:hypothetical protein
MLPRSRRWIVRSGIPLSSLSRFCESPVPWRRLAIFVLGWRRATLTVRAS